MDASNSLPELVAAARLNAQKTQDRIAALKDDVGESASHSEDLTAATVALELAAVDIFAVFEARMQHHFKRGPFSRKLKSALLDAGQADLADRVHQYYLAVNVLKHGTGASFRELRANKSTLVVLREKDEHATVGLIDVTVPGFFDGLTGAILEAVQFLENR